MPPGCVRCCRWQLCSLLYAIGGHRAWPARRSVECSGQLPGTGGISAQASRDATGDGGGSGASSVRPSDAQPSAHRHCVHCADGRCDCSPPSYSGTEPAGCAVPHPRTPDSFPAICTRSSCASWRNHPGRPHNDSGRAAPCYRSIGLSKVFSGQLPRRSGQRPDQQQVSR